MDNGSVMNTATASSAFDGNPVDSNQDLVTVNAYQAPALTLDKTSQETTFSQLGEQLDYTYTVTNTGNVTITDSISIADDKATVSCPAIPVGGFMPGNFMTCTASHSVTQADLDAGVVTNLATASSTFGGNPVTSNQDTVTITGIQTPGITLDKTTTTADYDAPADVLDYAYEVTNSGNVTLTQSFTVTDDKTTVTCPALPIGGLAPTASITCTATYSVLQADIDTGSVVNTATAETTYDSNPVSSNPDSVTIDAVQIPALTLDKSTLVSDFAVVGQSLDYSYEVTNSGNTTVVDPITVADDKATVTCPALPVGGLAPTASITCSASYTVTQADLDDGSVTNVATATDGNVTSPSDSVTVNAFQNPGLTLDKTTQKSAIAVASEPVAYTYTVTNSGNITITDQIAVTDDKVTVSCPAIPGAGLAPGSFITCTASYIVLQADLDAGSLTNIASAQAGALTSNTDTVTIVAFQQPSLALDKTTQEVDFDMVGDALDYTYTVTNTGNITITNAITIADDKTTVTCPALPVGGLAPGSFITCTSIYSVVQSDIDDGFVTNVATASTVYDGSPIDSNSDTVTISAIQGPSLGLVVSTTTPDYDETTDVIDYTYEVTNTGNTTVTDPITVTGDHASPITCPALPIGRLAPGSSITCAGSYPVDQADIDAGSVTNDAVATDSNAVSNNDGVTVDAVQNPALLLVVATPTPDYDEPGDVIDYTYEVTNSGNTTITDPIMVSGDHASPITCPALPVGGLAPGASITCTGDYSTDQADVDAGNVVNDAVATDGSVLSNRDGVTVNAIQNPELTLDVTTTTADFDEPGDVIDYTYEVTNSGNTTITDPITVTDPHGNPVACDPLPTGGLAPGQAITCTGSYTVDQDDVDAGDVTNDAVATDGNINSNNDGVTVDAVQTPELTLDVTTTTADYDEPTDVIDYSYEVTNSGNTTITDPITVTGDHAAPITCPALPAGGLAPGASITCTGSYSVDQSDVDAGDVTNDAVATDSNINSNNDGVTVNAVQTPELTLDVTTTTPDYDEPGDTIDYSYEVTNSGNTTIADPITVADPHGNPVTCPALPLGGLTPGASITCTGSYDVDQADVDAGDVTNDAVATDSNINSNNDGVNVPAVQNPALTLDVTTTTPDFDEPGVVIDYSYEVTNSGNTTITDPITVTDPHGNPVSCDPLPAGGLAPGASITCTGSYTVDQADVDAGGVTNDAVASDGNVNSNNDGVTVDAIQTPEISLDVTTSTPDYNEPSDVIDYAYEVTNSGNTTVTDPISVAGDHAIPILCPPLPAGGLLPGASITCVGDYTTDQADVDAGDVTNDAIASSGALTSNNDGVSVPAIQNPELTLNVTTTTPDYDEPTDVIDYSYEVTNSGNTTITDPISVTGDHASPITCPALPVGGLAPGAAITCSGSYSVDQADVDAGDVTNDAVATDGNINSNNDGVNVTAIQNPALTLDVTTTTPDFDEPGDTIDYIYEVTNSGNTTITDPITVTDPHGNPVTCDPLPAGGLAPGVSLTCTGSYTVDQDDVDAGDVTNDAVATDGITNSNNDGVTVDAVQTPEITLDVTTTTPDYDESGDVIAYDYEVTNSGNTTITDPISVTGDHASPITCPALPAGGLAPGSSITCTGSYSVDQADVDAGDVTNDAVATDGNINSNNDGVNVPAIQNPGLTLDVTTTTPDFDEPGDTVSYSYEVTNSGNVTITDPVSVTDPHGNPVTCDPLPAGGLAPGASITCTGAYTVDQDDVDAGDVTNNAVATDGNVNSNNDGVNVPAVQNPEITLDVTTTTPDYGMPADVIDYSYEVTNSGNTTITNPISVAGDHAKPITCPALPAGGLAPGTSITCSGSYDVVQGDVDAGDVTNDAVATDGTIYSNNDGVTVNAVQTLALTLDVTTTTPNFDEPGDTIDYSYEVTNSGNTSITDPITVTDPHGNPVTCDPLPAGGLAPGASLTCTGTYTVIQDDVDAGDVTNDAVATDGTTNSNNDGVPVFAIQNPALDLEKTASIETYSIVGQVISYTYEVTNSGNVTFTHPISVADNRTTVTCPAVPAGGLMPTISITCTSSQTVTQQDIDDGFITNVATAGSQFDGAPIASNQDEVTVNADLNPELTLVVSTSTPDFDEPGDVIDYTYEVTNTGNTSITDPITVNDPVGNPVTCDPLPAGGMLPGQAISCTGSYTVDQDDVDVGDVTNDAVATDGTTDSNNDGVTVDAVQTPEITLDVTTTTPDFDEPGDVIDYSYEVTNSGNTTITDPISVMGDHADPITCPALPAGGLLPGASITCVGTYPVDQADVDAGSVTNDAVATDGTTISNNDGVTVNGVQTPEISLDVTTTTPDYNEAGDTIDYEYEVTNSGNVTITDPISVAGDHANPITCPALPAGGLLPGASIVCTGAYPADQNDVDVGAVTNDAVATSGALTSNNYGVVVDAVQTPDLTLVVTTTTPDFDEPGDVIDYSYEVTNSGNITLTDPITVTDPNGDPVSCDPLPAGGLAPGASITCTGSYTVDQDDVDAGDVTNDAVATDGTTDSNNDGVTVDAVQTPEITLDVTTTTPDFDEPGDVIDYSYEVTNSGNTTITDPISVMGDHADPITCSALPAGGLLPGDSITCAGTYPVNQADVDAGSVTNDAVATDGTINSNNDGVSVDAVQAPQLTLDVTTTTPDFDEPGDVIDYSYEVTNSGNTTITGPITVTDPNGDPVTCDPLPAGGLTPGAAITCTGSYPVDQDDVDAGEVTNEAVASDGTTNSDPDGVTVDAVQTPGLTLDVTTTTPDFDEPGDVIDYTYEVTNSGNTTITDPITVTDPNGDPVTCDPLPAGGLLPGAAISCIGAYTVDQDDVDAGEVTNEAVASDGSTNSNPDGVTVDAVQTPEITLDVTTTTPDYDEAGDVIDYEYEVTNSGNTTITDPISVTGDHADPIACPALPAGGLVPGASITCSGSYPVDQADVDGGSVTNDATATDGILVSNNDGVTVNAIQTPGLSLVVTPSVTDFDEPGDVIDCTYEVTNSGNTTLIDPITVTDPHGNPVTCDPMPAGGLLPGQTLTCTGTYTTTQDDVDAGGVTNEATATDGSNDATDDATVDAIQNPVLEIEATADTDLFLNIGDPIEYSFVVTNGGNTTITDPISLLGDNVGAVCPDLPAGGLGVGQSITCTASYVVTEDDFLAGQILSQPVATDGTTQSDPDEVLVTAGTAVIGSGKVLQEVVNLRDGRFVLTYILTAVNAGTGALINVAIFDEMQNASGDFEGLQPTDLSAAALTGDLLDGIDTAFTPNAAWAGQLDVNVITDGQELAPGEVGGVLISVTIEPMGVIDEVINTAIAYAIGAGGVTVSDVSSAEFVGSTDSDGNTAAPLVVNPVISTVKEALGEPMFIGNGQYKIGYRITMSNIGDIVLRDVQLADNLAAVFQTALVGVENVTLVAAPAGFTGALNPDYNGLTDVNIFDGMGELSAPSEGQDVGDGLIVTFDVIFEPAVPFFAYENVALASGDAPISAATVEAEGTAEFLVDPNGIIYDSVTGVPIPGAKVEMVDGANVILPAQCLAPGQQSQVTDNTGYYRFDVNITGNDPACPVANDELRIVVTAPDGYSFTSVIVPPIAGIYDPTACPAPAVLVGNECQFSASWTVQAASLPPYYLRFELEPGDPDVVRNHIPLDFLPTAGSVAVQKRALLPVASVGDTILYELQITNLAAVPMTIVSIVDQPPAGFTYLANTAVASSTTVARQVEPVQSGGTLTWSIAAVNAAPMDVIAAGETLTIEYRLQVTGAVDLGSYKNSASVLNNLNNPISNIAEATVRIEADPVFDCPEVIGQVFNDVNMNGYQDVGETGIAAARMLTARGEAITSDKHGRFHVSCALIPNKNHGSNFILKLDPRSLPTGYRITTENPRVVRLTRGKMTKVNFGTSISKVIRLEIDDRGFAGGSDELTAGLIEATKVALEEVPDEQITLRLIYVATQASSTLVNRRIDSFAKWVQRYWNRSSRRTRLDRDQIELEIIDHSGQKVFWENVESNVEQFFASDTIATVDLSNQPLVRLSLDGRPRSAVPAVAKEDDDRTIDVALAKSNIRVTSSSLDVQRALNVTGRVVSTENGREIQFFPYWNYGGWIERAEVRLFEDGQSTQGVPTVAIEIDPMMKARAMLKGGEAASYRYVLRVYDEEGRFDETSPKTLSIPAAGQETAASSDMDLSGYGRNTLAISSIPVTGGAVTVSGHSVPTGTEVLVMGRVVPVSTDGAFVVQEILPNGTHNVTLALMDKVAEDQEPKGLEFQRRIRVKDQDFIAVGLADVTVGSDWGDTTTDEDVYVDGRLAFYFKGKVKGDVLITAMADTGEGDVETLFEEIDERDARSLLKRLDPDRYYNVYGDASQIEEDAPTSGKFYLRVEKDKSYGLWGNFQTGFNDTEYGRLDRSLYGAKGVYKSLAATSLGESLTEVKAFAADPGTLAAQDRFRGTGGSVYFLRRNDITIGSEQLRIEVVDRTSGIIRESRQLVYGTDYDIDYLQGRIILSHAMASTVEDGSLFSDGNLSGHYMYLVADYEFVSSTTDSDEMLYGGRASQWIGDYVRLGGTYYKTEKDVQDNEFRGADMTLRFRPKTYIKAEVAETTGSVVRSYSSSDGGYTFTPSTVVGGSTEATGIAVEGSIDLGEVSQDQLKGRVSGYFRDREAGFATQRDAVSTDTTNYGGAFEVEFAKGSKIAGLYDYEETAAGNEKSRAEIEFEQSLGDNFTIAAGALWEEDQTGREHTDVGVRAGFHTESWNIYAFGETTVDAQGGYVERDRYGVGGSFDVTSKFTLSGEISDGDGELGALAKATYRFNDASELYVAYDLSDRTNLGSGAGSLNIGGRTRYGDSLSIFGEERLIHNSTGITGLTHAYGIKYQISDPWTVGASFEHGTVDSLDRTSVSFESGVHTDQLKLAGVVEYRQEEDTATNIERLTYAGRATMTYQLDDSWKLQARAAAALSQSDEDAIGTYDGELVEGSVSLAHRPVDNDRVNFIAKYRFLHDLPPATQVNGDDSISNYKQRAHALSADVAIDLNRYFTLGGKYGFKFGEQTTSRTTEDWINAEAHLGIIRMDFHLLDQWDALAEGRALYLAPVEETQFGGLVGVYRHFGENVKLGGGFNFSRFSDDLMKVDQDDYGWFLNIVGKY